MKNRWGGLLGFRAGGTTSNMVVSMSACTTQLLEVSLRAVTRTEYLWATVIPTTSIGDASTSVYRERKKYQLPNKRRADVVFRAAYTVNFNDSHFMTIDPEEKGSKCGSVDDAQAVRLPRFKWQSSIFIESNFRPRS